MVERENNKKALFVDFGFSGVSSLFFCWKCCTHIFPGLCRSLFAPFFGKFVLFRSHMCGVHVVGWQSDLMLLYDFSGGPTLFFRNMPFQLGLFGWKVMIGFMG